ncbi:beta-lactamase-like protein [Colletotrichum phormii]|uniref:Protein artemis n=1 Tax=Colletotrichum phormii TaxID=359342 RepID=A0AAJ0EDM1_9PEZI|nr:beta-lactamase-like protein [Colletotrichum phormii]KAK1633236.1 beta-lactamase-like protein [Colletotrichum phormii]
MSTFNGLVAEFPDIRIDFFRKHADRRPPLACFLSHIHSDHLAGLDSLRSPFVYCSAATREMLLRLERYPCRINYAKGVLEARVQTYKHLKNLLKPLPLETPTTLELAPGSHIQVTLFDANHCPGAVMFLIEDSYHAILYTGDIRSEPWFVNTIARNPAIIEYTSGMKTLDKIYLDTSFIKDIPFQTKAEGTAELLRKVAQYPDDTVFHIQAWTYGYEQVWIALAKALKSRIHVDDYKMRIFSSLTGKRTNDRFSSSIHLCPEAPALAGYVCGNTPHPGCLTRDKNVRLHSCERGNFCNTVKSSKVVSIQPVIAHLRSGVDIAEVGVGGGGDDLERDAELDPLSTEDIAAVSKLIEEADISPEAKLRFFEFLETGAKTGRNLSLDLDLASFGEKNEAAIMDVFQAVGRKKQLEEQSTQSLKPPIDGPSGELPRFITFPYSRHSSYQELCDLVRVFRPKDVWPCTVNPADWLRNTTSIRYLFGDFCSGDTFAHDMEMEKLAESLRILQQPLSQGLGGSQLPATEAHITALHSSHSHESNASEPSAVAIEETLVLQLDTNPGSVEARIPTRERHDFSSRVENSQNVLESPIPHIVPTPLVLFADVSHIRADAYYAMEQNFLGGEWTPIGLLSTIDHHTTPDTDLGMV